MTTPTDFPVCPRCGDIVPPECDATGEGPVYWTVSEEPFCSMECVVYTHRRWLEQKELRSELSAQEVLAALKDRSEVQNG